MNKSKFNRNEEIYKLYFYSKMTFSEISKVVNISISQVSRIVRKNENYIDEKAKRINENKLKNKEFTKQFMKKKRKSHTIGNRDEKAILDYSHNQASCELSGKRTINNRAFRNWNSSIYEFHQKTKEYRLKEEFKNKTSYAVPKKIKWN